MKNSIVISQEVNTKNNKFSKAAFLNKIKKGIVKVYENNSNVNNVFVEVNPNSILKMKDGLRFHANYENDKSKELRAYLGTSFSYKFTY